MEADITNKKIGFILLRYVNNGITDTFWFHCYNCIRKFYPENHILIIDDNSDINFLTTRELYKTTIINSDYPRRGELLPYYYYLHNKLFDTAVIIHDTVFINKYIDINIDKYKILWDFEHHYDVIDDETEMINLFNDKELLNFYENKSLWKGAFGCMSIITHEYLHYINSKYDISKLLEIVKTRSKRCAFERVIGCLLSKEHKCDTLLGDIHKYIQWGITFENKDDYPHLPIIKIWTGR
jgi:hypothetical protein